MTRPLVLLFVLISVPVARADEPPPVETTAAAPRLELAPYGFLRLKGAIVEDDPNVAFVGRNDGFVLQNARIGLSGTWRDRVAFELSADGAVEERPGVNSTEGLLRVGLKDAYVDVRAVPALVVRAGRFLPVWDLDEIYP